MSVTKLHSGRYRKQIYIGRDENGKRIYESFIADTEAEVNLLAAARRVELDKGIKQKNTPHNMTVGEAIDQYIDDRDGILSPKTVREYKGLRRNCLQGIMHLRLPQLNTSNVQRAINNDAKRLAPKSVRNAYALFQSSLKAVNSEMKFSIILPQPQKKEIKIPTEKELERILDAVYDTNLEIPVLLGATCGLRRGEVSALDLNKDIDYEKCVITINKSMAINDESKWVIKAPKTTSSKRTLRLPKWVAERIAEVKDNYTPITPDNLTHYFREVCERLGIDIHYHSLRHYFASTLLALGVPDKYAMKRTGHATPNMLKTVYQHIMDQKDIEIDEATDAWFDSFKPQQRL